MLPIATALSAAAQARSGGPSAQSSRLWASRKIVRFVALGVAAYLATLVATVPADVALPRSQIVGRFDGTLWHGEALLAGGHRIGWDWAPLRSLLALGFVADWHAAGPGTDLKGQALLRPRCHADRRYGRPCRWRLPRRHRARPALLLRDALRREPASHHDGRRHLSAGGRLLSEAGTCRRTGSATATTVAPLAIVAARASTGSRVTITPQGQRRLRLAEARPRCRPARSYDHAGRYARAAVPCAPRYSRDQLRAVVAAVTSPPDC